MPSSKLIDPNFFGGVSHSKSFLQALAGSTSSFPDLRLSNFRGLPSLWVSDEEIMDLAEPFRFSLVGFFPLKRPPLEAIRKFFFNLKLNGEVSVTVLDSTHILIKLANDLDYCRVFCHRSYLVFNCFMKITKWSPSLDIGVESPIIPIWISFPHLRPHFFAPRILFGLGELFGKPLKIDEATLVGSRPSNARVLVEIDITKTYTKQVWLGSESLGYVQEVAFDEFPQFCSVCKCLGHLSGKCNSVANFGIPSTAVSPVDNLPNLGNGNGLNVIEKPESAGVVLPSVGPTEGSPAAGFCGMTVPAEEGVLDDPIVVGLNNVVADLCEGHVSNPQVAVNLEIVQADKVLNDEVLSGVVENLLSPNAIPFFPSSGDSGHLPERVACPENNMVTVACETLVSNPIVVDIGPPGESSVMGNVDETEIRMVHSSVGGHVENVIMQDSFINVPVNLMEAKTIVGLNSGLDVRSHGDWLNNSSDFDSDADPVSDSDFDVKLVRDRSHRACPRGKLWKRGGRRR
ncbi:hypothetical protein MA16_Dca001131 [Dendrobium catenatum]|uniref:DUF4283 domain-containing protein n=1 Tax=Dendrobium catenatum TaxID=906689 RepID=A0A2I0WLJ2_9ASPA|nr:hypothetical protein MA16_Dca001131 [Dendrobium catenatum]